jgi:uridylate kinase
MAEPSYKRLLIKVSGESLCGDSVTCIDAHAIERLQGHVQAARDMGVKVALVIGGGNIWRGKDSSVSALARTDADMIGMLATLMNAIAIRGIFEGSGMPSVIFSALAVPSICEAYTHRKALEHLERGDVILFASGTGSPFFTTDTAATLRALEMNCDLLLKLTKVNGVYDKDPLKHKDAKRFDTITFQEVLEKHYGVMDATAVALAEDGGLPVCVGSFFDEAVVSSVLEGRGSVTRMIKGE